MRVWCVRAGARGEREQFALDNDVVVIGWQELDDLTSVGTWEELTKLLSDTYPNKNKRSIGMSCGQIWRFLKEISENDMVLLPLKSTPTVAVGKIVGPYKFVPTNPPDAKHVRPVKWLEKSLPRSMLDADIQRSLYTYLTVFKVGDEECAKRIQKAVNDFRRGRLGVGKAVEGEMEESVIDPEQVAFDLILKHIEREFSPHELAKLVAEIFKAQGFNVEVSQPGPDGGVDVLAAAGELGTSKPHICIQVKSGKTVVDVRMLREFRDTVRKFRADYGFLISWSGFNSAARQEARSDFFHIKLWDARALVEALLGVYPKLPEEWRQRVPLKRIWTLALWEGEWS